VKAKEKQNNTFSQVPEDGRHGKKQQKLKKQKKEFKPNVCKSDVIQYTMSDLYQIKNTCQK